MAEPINLNRARKARARAADAAQARQNRAAFGTPKAERVAAAARTEAERRRVDAHRREHQDE